MARATKNRIFVSLNCELCKKEKDKKLQNYVILLNQKNKDIKTVTRNKYCKACNKSTSHKATKLKSGSK